MTNGLNSGEQPNTSHPEASTTQPAVGQAQLADRRALASQEHVEVIESIEAYSGWALGIWNQIKEGKLTPEEGAQIIGRGMASQRFEAKKHETAAFTDVLTGLSNRRGFEKDIAHLITNSASFGLLIIDIDKFKTINDSHTHAGGDTALRQIATTLVTQIRPEDRAYRFGGDEFAVLLKGMQETDSVSERAEEIRKAVENQQINILGESIRATVSIGGTASLANDNKAEIVRRADESLYIAKADRNAVSVRLPEK